MNFSEVVAAVTDITKRPDKIVDVRREVNSAIAHFCSDASFDFDREEIAVPIDATLYQQDIPMSTFPRWRKFWYLKQAGSKIYLNKLNERDLGKTDCDIRNKYYVSGTNLRISMATLASSLEVGFYKVPPILSGTDEFWLIDMYPYPVIDRTASKIFASIGDDASSRLHEGFAIAAYRAIKNDREVLA